MYTMKGITEYAVADIYDYIDKHPEVDFVLKLSALEISSGSVKDLLPSEHPEKGKAVEISTEEILRDRDHATQLLSSLLERRSREAAANEGSSLLHLIIRLKIESLPHEILDRNFSFVSVSDEEMVKHLQKEVARLESELRNSQSSIAIIVEKKDTQIEQLEKEIRAVILQRDIAQSQANECLKMLEADARSSIEAGHYPQIRVHASPDSEMQDLESFRSSSRDHFAKVLYTEGRHSSGPRASISSLHSSDIEYVYSSGEETTEGRLFVEPEELSCERATESSFSNLEEAPRLHANDNLLDARSMKSDLKDEPNGRGSTSPCSSIEYLDISSVGNQASRHEYLDDIMSKLNRCRSCKESVAAESASQLLKMTECTESLSSERETETGPGKIGSSLKKEHQSSPEILDIEIESPNVKISTPQRDDKATVEDGSLNGTRLARTNVGDELRGLASWPVEFKRLQREILHLWHVCNISLAHRTYFFLLFRGDPSDAMYMEMEIRRIRFLKGKFSRGEKATVNLKCLTHSSSATALRQERRMLSDQMLKKFSEKERESLFVEWGIDLNTKMRRLKLARQIWSETDNIDHVTSSAYLVAKLLGFIEPGHVPCEDICNLKFAPKSHMGICSFKSSLMSIL